MGGLVCRNNSAGPSVAQSLCTIALSFPNSQWAEGGEGGQCGAEDHTAQAGSTAKEQPRGTRVTGGLLGHYTLPSLGDSGEFPGRGLQLLLLVEGCGGRLYWVSVCPCPGVLRSRFSLWSRSLKGEWKSGPAPSGVQSMTTDQQRALQGTEP